MMDKNYANRMLITDLMLIGLFLFVILYSANNNEQEENMTRTATEQVLDTEVE